MKPFIYKRFGRWSCRIGIRVTTVWTDEDMKLETAIYHFKRCIDAVEI